MKKTILLAALVAATAVSAKPKQKIAGTDPAHPEMAYVATTAQLTLDAKQIKKDRVTLTVGNPNAADMTDAPVCVKLPAGNAYLSATVTCDGVEVPSQLDDLNTDGVMDELALVIDLKAQASRTIEVTLSKKAAPADRYTSRVFTDMRLRKVKKGRTIDLRDENPQIDTISEVEDTHYSDVYPHGLCFENEVMGYRVYFNAGHGTDLYGKRVRQLELDNSMWYTPEQREEAAKHNWGEDYIVVGSTVSLGTLRGWNDANDNAEYLNTVPDRRSVDPCMQMITPFAWRQAHIVAKGPVRTVVDMNVEGWQYQGHLLNTKSRYILYAGNREHQIVQQVEDVTPADQKAALNVPLDVLEFVTGVMKVGCLNADSIDVAMTQYMADGRGLCASYGKDWPDPNHNLFPYMSKAALALSLPVQNITRTIDRREQIMYGVRLNADGSLIYRAACAAPDLETFAPFEDGRWNYRRWFEWAEQWHQLQPAVVNLK